MPSAARDKRLPVTPDILRRLHGVWKDSMDSHDTVMLWAACCLGFFGFLHSGEFTAKSDRDVDPSSTLMLSDVSLDDRENPRLICVHIKQSKNDQFRAGVRIYLGRTGSHLCPVTAILNYLAVRSREEDPLFVFSDGRYLSRQRLVSHLQTALRSCGIDPCLYTGHSFRIGAATTAASVGIEDSVIQMLGRWRSAAFLRYVRTPREQLASISGRLIGPAAPPSDRGQRSISGVRV